MLFDRSLPVVAFSISCVTIICLQCFDAVGWAAGRASGLHVKTEWWGAGVVVCLEQGADNSMIYI